MKPEARSHSLGDAAGLDFLALSVIFFALAALLISGVVVLTIAAVIYVVFYLLTRGMP